jgi:outer membrane protein OmpA-like peptidoglycan-associated protein
MRLFLATLSLALLPLLAHADDLQVELISKVQAGQGKPALVLIANKAIADAKVRLQGPKGRTLQLRSHAVAKGQRKELSLDAPTGRSSWRGTLEVEFVDGTSGSMPLSFQLYVSPGLQLVPPKRADVDPQGGTVRLAMQGGDASHCEYEVAFDGKASRTGTTRFDGAPAGSPLTVSWKPHGADDVVLRIRLVCHDVEGFYSPTLEVYPWEAPIAHDDVVFATGKWEILPEERPKLDAAYEAIAAGIRRYGKVLEKEIKLYVAGHTDTVGDAASNKTLSLRRAQAIANYFRQKGVTIPIYFTGFGKERPLVATPDQTDEPRNRRAEYIISVEKPAAAKWTRL